MSDTAIDMAKVTQMLDAGWHVELYKNELGSYTVTARHESWEVIHRARERYLAACDDASREFAAESWDEHDQELITDDFTPEQALTRMAYKVHGEVI